MKKILFVFLFSMLTLKPVFCMSKQNDTTKTFSKDQAETITKTLEDLSKRMEKLEGLDKSKIVSEKSKLQKIFSALGVVPEKAAQLANYVYSNLDKKGMLTMLCILTPIFAVYCTFFSPDLVSGIAGWFSYWWGKLLFGIGRGVGKGAGDALNDEFKNATDTAGDLASKASEGIFWWMIKHPIQSAEIGVLVYAPSIITSIGTTALLYVKLKLGLIKPS